MINLNTLNHLPRAVKLYNFTKLFLMSILFLPVFLFFFPLWILFFGSIFIYFLIYYNNFNYTVEADKITINCGVLSRTSKTVPFDKVQNVEVSRGLLSILFNVSLVRIWTSSQGQIQKEGIKPDIRLQLIHSDSEWLKNFVVSKK